MDEVMGELETIREDRLKKLEKVCSVTV